MTVATAEDAPSVACLAGSPCLASHFHHCFLENMFSSGFLLQNHLRLDRPVPTASHLVPTETPEPTWRVNGMAQQKGSRNFKVPMQTKMENAEL